MHIICLQYVLCSEPLCFLLNLFFWDSRIRQTEVLEVFGRCLDSCIHFARYQTMKQCCSFLTISKSLKEFVPMLVEHVDTTPERHKGDQSKTVCDFNG